MGKDMDDVGGEVRRMWVEKKEGGCGWRIM